MKFPSWGKLTPIAYFFCRRNYEYLKLASRNVAGILAINGRPLPSPKIMKQNSDRSVLEALEDPDVVNYSDWLAMAPTYGWSRWKFESLPNYSIDTLWRLNMNIEYARVFDWHDGRENVPIYRFKCCQENGLIRDREVLFKRDMNGFTAVAEVRMARDVGGWDHVDEIHQLWKTASSSIGPLS